MSFSTDKSLFVCDDHLGKLARLLRLGGYDTFFDSVIDNSRLIQVSLDEKRWILTRDTRLIERRLVRRVFLIEHDRWQEQLKAVIDHFGLVFAADRLFTRCLEDNALIQPVAKEAIQRQVFPYTYEHFEQFYQCPACRRVYWAGTHTAAMLDRIRKAGIIIQS
jgi:uncharacterized protein with PIN domain